MDSNGKMYSVKEFAALTGWSPDSIRRRIRAGLILAFKLPSLAKARKRVYECFRIPETELGRWKLN